LADEYLGSGWDEDKALMGRWGLTGMDSFESKAVAAKELLRPTENRTI
jgi:biotin synthase